MFVNTMYSKYYNNFFVYPNSEIKFSFLILLFSKGN